MFINPRTAIQEGWIEGIQCEEDQVQPNAIDFTLDQVWSVGMISMFAIGLLGKQMRTRGEMLPVEDRATGREYWRFKAGTFYDCLSSIYVRVPEGVAAWLIARSTLTRNGIFLTSGLYDSGFEGHVGFVLNNQGGQASFEKGVRVGQIIFVKSESAGVYVGGYNHKAGTAPPHVAGPAVAKPARIPAPDLSGEGDEHTVTATEAEKVEDEAPAPTPEPEKVVTKSNKKKTTKKKTAKKKARAAGRETQARRKPAAIEAALDDLKGNPLGDE